MVALLGVVEDFSDLRDKSLGLKTESRPLTFTKAVTEFSEPICYRVLMYKRILLDPVMKKMLKQYMQTKTKSKSIKISL
jgi:hypothetical protein